MKELALNRETIGADLVAANWPPGKLLVTRKRWSTS